MNLTLKSAGRNAGRNASLMAAMSLCMIVSAFAGTTDTEFQQLLNKVVGWAGGYAGKALAVVSLLVGVMTGMARTNFLPVIAGVGFALALAFGPNILTGIVSATI
jgi:conjugal transfer pilus assembly protein TraA